MSNSDDDDPPVGSSIDSTTKEDDDWQHITKPGPHDVLCGRGGGTNNHPGNVKFRQVVNDYKLRYLAASKVEKPKVARDVVKIWRDMDPSGRFLARKDDSKRGPGSVKAEGNVWHDVGDRKAREKASQCLRERTPDVLPYVREMQRRQDLLTGQGLRLVEQQMRMRNDQGGGGGGLVGMNGQDMDGQMSVQMNGQINGQMNGGYPLQPGQQHGGAFMAEPDINNAFSVEHHFTHGFQNTAASYASVNPDDPLSLQQMSQDPHRWDQSASFNGAAHPGAHHQMPPPQQVFSSSGADLEHIQAFLNMQQQHAPRPDNVGSNMLPPIDNNGGVGGGMPPFGSFRDDELTLEEYIESMKDHKAYHLNDASGTPRTNELLGMQSNSWVKSFHSIDNASKMSSIDSAALHHDKPPSKKKSSKRQQQGLEQALSKATTSGGSHLPRQQSTRSHLSATTQKSAMSAMSTKSGHSAMSGISMFSDMTEKSRDSKMDAARGMASSLSMMSDFTELTDLSETLGNIDLASTAPSTAS